MRSTHHHQLALALLLAGLGVVRAEDIDALPARAAVAARQAVGYLTREVAVSGGYPTVVRDGVRLGFPGELGPLHVAVGPGATAELGVAMLQVSQAIDDRTCLAAALDAARCLARWQLVSGGWSMVIDTTPDGMAYTRALAAASVPQQARRDGSNLGEGVTPAGLRLLLEVGAASEDREVIEAAQYGVRALLQAQLSTGGWPMALPLPDDVRRWTTIGSGVTPAVIKVLVRAAELGYPGAADSAVRGAEFLLAARLPEPLPLWPGACDAGLAPRPGSIQTNACVAAGEALLAVARLTGEPRYVADLPATIAALEAMCDEDGRLPWVVDHETGQASEGSTRIQLGNRLRALRQALAQPLTGPREPGLSERQRLTRQRAPHVAALVAALAEDGVWHEDDGALAMNTWAGNLLALADYLRDYQPLEDPTDRADPRPPQHRRP